MFPIYFKGGRWTLFVATSITVFLMTFASTAKIEATDSSPTVAEEEEMPLCRALEEATAGSRTTLVVSGVLARDMSLYDPAEPVCRWDVQPSTLVVFRKHTSKYERLEQLLQQEGRVSIRVIGTMVGPRVLDLGNHLQPAAVYLANWMRNQYGFQHEFRTMLEVETILDYSKVPTSVPWAETVGKPRQGKTPTVIAASLPTYPREARVLDVEGQVHVKVTADDGKVVKVELLDGEPLLWPATKACVKNWRFNEHDSYVFTATFIYELEKRLSGEDGNATVCTRLPSLVRIVAPAYRW